MYSNKSDIAKNRLYVTFKGRLEVKEVDAGGTNVIQEARKLKPGFGCISDISEFIPTSEEGRVSMQNTMKALKDMKMGHVVRIVKNLESVAGSQWQRTSHSVGYDAKQVTNVADAEILLDKLEKGG